jgi:hypothetical protein
MPFLPVSITVYKFLKCNPDCVFSRPVFRYLNLIIFACSFNSVSLRPCRIDTKEYVLLVNHSLCARRSTCIHQLSDLNQLPTIAAYLSSIHHREDTPQTGAGSGAGIEQASENDFPLAAFRRILSFLLPLRHQQIKSRKRKLILTAEPYYSLSPRRSQWAESQLRFVGTRQVNWHSNGWIMALSVGMDVDIGTAETGKASKLGRIDNRSEQRRVSARGFAVEIHVGNGV